ncbi:hypothetical protein [Hymenobacter norwichensis]|uniref:hypothetical protein n=1 Tax=Hymenobacter norwichensis TaxID=223903 RepID=UPI0003B4F1EF|nr:hypothetical protein [Hymenobacter norwichensis]
MQLYSYWSWATLDCRNADGNPYYLTAYAGSDTSPAAAKTAAEQLVQQRYTRLLAGDKLGEYPTGSAPLREQLIQRVHDSQGNQIAALTRNRYGSLVLNAPRLMMLDVDDQGLQPEPESEPFSLRHFLRNLFSPLPPPPRLSPPELREQLRLRLTAWLQLYPDWNFRLYRTCLGFRLLVTHQLLDPNSPKAQEVFSAMRTDKIYVRLCQMQNCYRARLSPKPWRIGWRRPPHSFPYRGPEEEQEQQQWEQQYIVRSEAFSVCEWVGEYGSSYVLPEVKSLIELHDEVCLGGKKLA